MALCSQSSPRAPPADRSARARRIDLAAPPTAPIAGIFSGAGRLGLPTPYCRAASLRPRHRLRSPTQCRRGRRRYFRELQRNMRDRKKRNDAGGVDAMQNTLRNSQLHSNPGSKPMIANDKLTGLRSQAGRGGVAAGRWRLEEWPCAVEEEATMRGLPDKPGCAACPAGRDARPARPAGTPHITAGANPR